MWIIIFTFFSFVSKKDSILSIPWIYLIDSEIRKLIHIFSSLGKSLHFVVNHFDYLHFSKILLTFKFLNFFVELASDNFCFVTSEARYFSLWRITKRTQRMVLIEKLLARNSPFAGLRIKDFIMHAVFKR